MAKSKQQKKEILEKIVDKIDKARSAVLVGYEKVKITDQDKLRKSLKKEDGELLITKKTLLKLAFKELKLEDAKDLNLEKEVALALSYGDEITSARIVASLAKTVKNLVIKGGIFEKKIIGAEKIKFLAGLPSKKILQAQLLSIFQGPLSSLINVLQGNLRNLVYVLKAISEKTN